MVKVAKFGGSSLKTAHHIKHCVGLAQKHSYKAIVVSATDKTTRQLLNIYQENNLALYDAIYKTHLEMAHNLDRSGTLAEKIKHILSQLQYDLTHSDKTPKAKDKILSYGEQLSATLFAHTAGIPFVDSRSIILTDDTFGAANSQKTTPPSGFFVTQGFIGATKSGDTTTLGFEGSDYSAALIAQSLKATQLDIWTDVPGIFAADPNTVPTAAHIPFLSYQQMDILARMGAQVLHPKTVHPLKEHGIPLHVRSSHKSDMPGSLIHNKSAPDFVAMSSSGDATLNITGVPLDKICNALQNQMILEQDGFFSIDLNPGNLQNTLITTYNALYKSIKN